MIAALYIDPRGPYPQIPGVECWGLPERDAREYDGPWPVIAHPPCSHYSNLRHLALIKDAECAPRAVEQVRQWGGVLEHPARSSLFAPMTAGCLPWPGELPDPWLGCTIELDQCEFGHVARKRTWVYVVGVRSLALEPPPFPGRIPTHWCSGRRGMSKANDNVPVGIKVCSAEQRRRTPPLFAEYLVRLAAQARAA